MIRSPKYMSGDRVVSLRGARGNAGVIVKYAPVLLRVRWDDAPEDESVRMEDVRPETPADVAQRGRAHALRAWEDRQPKLSHVMLSKPTLWGSTLPDGVQPLRVMRTPAAMREAAAELLQLADWFAEKPEDL